jgi:hypothetical protein
MNADDALDFDLLIAPDRGGYRVRLLDSPAGTASSVFALPFSDLEIENLVLRMGQVRTGLRRRESPQTEAAREFGRRLFEAVFNDDLAACWQNSAAEAARQGKRLRLRLRLSDAPELLDLPWEYLYDNVADRFVALSSNTPLVRYLDLPGRVEPLPVSGPLRVLALIASPQDMPPLDVEREWQNLQTALADLIAGGLVQLDRCPQPTLPELQRSLRRQEMHIFHFVGHGGYDSRESDGMLLFEDEQGRARPVSGRQLGALLHDEGLLRLAVLNACEGARTSRTDPFAGVGQSLLQQGVPAVIAMQFAITDTAASTFAHEFYAAVADGYSVDRSLAEARKAMFARADSVEWGTPVLYLRAIEGRIFNLLTPPHQAQPPAQAQAIKPPPSPSPGAQASSPAPPVAQASSSAPPASAGKGSGRFSLLSALLVLAAVGAAIAIAVSFLLPRINPAPAEPTAGAQATAGDATAGALDTEDSTETDAAAALATLSPAFEYTFEDGAGGWTGDTANWAVIPDETGSNSIYQATAPPGGYTAIELPDKEEMSTWRNYAIQMRLRAHQAGSNPDLAEFWLTTRAPLAEVEGCSYYNTYFDFRNKHIALTKGGADASCQDIPIADNSYLPLETGSNWHDVVVTVQEDHLQVAVDGAGVIDARDSDVQAGYIFFSVGGGAIVQVDDVAVYKLDE